MTIALVFPGQGSQAVGMGKEFFDNFACTRHVFEEISNTLKQDITQLIFEGPQDVLTLTENAQPAIMAVSMAIMRTIEHESHKKIQDFTSYVAGHSLGEYSALCANQVLTLTDTTRLLKLRGQSMQNAVPIGEGTMAAILGLDIETVERLCEGIDSALGICVVANDNSPGQIVISGHNRTVQLVMDAALQQGAKRALKLPVSAPFHCPLMEPAAQIMAEALEQTTFHEAACPVIANVTAQPEINVQRIQNLLVDQITGRVRWRETIESFEALGIDTVVEVGPGQVLTGLVKRINSNLKAFAINKPADLNNFLALL